MIKLKTSRRSVTGIVAVFAVALIGVSLSHLSYAASGSLSLTPSSGSVTVGNNLVVTMYENSGTDAAIGVDAFINYSSNLHLASASTNTSPPFNVGTPDSASGGTVEIVRGDYTGQTGNQAVSTITFKTLSAGTATVTFNNSKSVISPVTGSANLLVTSSGGSYILANASGGGGSGTGGGGGTTGSGSGSPAPSTGTTNSKGTSVSVKPKSAPAVTVPNNGAVSVTTPVSVQPATVQPDGVTKVEYYLGGKLARHRNQSSLQVQHRYHQAQKRHLQSGQQDLLHQRHSQTSHPTPHCQKHRHPHQRSLARTANHLHHCTNRSRHQLHRPNCR